MATDDSTPQGLAERLEALASTLRAEAHGRRQHHDSDGWSVLNEAAESVNSIAQQVAQKQAAQREGRVNVALLKSAVGDIKDGDLEIAQLRIWQVIDSVREPSPMPVQETEELRKQALALAALKHGVGVAMQPTVMMWYPLWERVSPPAKYVPLQPTPIDALAAAAEALGLTPEPSLMHAQVPPDMVMVPKSRVTLLESLASLVQTCEGERQHKAKTDYPNEEPARIAPPKDLYFAAVAVALSALNATEEAKHDR